MNDTSKESFSFINFSGGTKDQTGLTSFKFDIFSLYLIVESVHDIYTCVINSSIFLMKMTPSKL